MVTGERGALAKLGHVRPHVVNPDSLGVSLVRRLALGEEEDIGLHPLSIEDARRQSQDRMQIALLHQIAADIHPRVIFKEHIVWHHHRTAATRLQASVTVLQEAKLFITGDKGEIIPGGCASPFLGAKGGIGEDDIGGAKSLTIRGQGIATEPVALNVVQHGIHEGQAVGIGDEFHAIEGVQALEILFTGFELEEVIGLLLDVLVSDDEEATGAQSRILDVFTRLGLDEFNHAFDEGARREVLTRTTLLLIGIALEQAFIEIAQAFLLCIVPVEGINIFDELGQVLGLAQRSRSIVEDGLHPWRAMRTQVDEQFPVELEPLGVVLLIGEVGPAVALGKLIFLAGFLHHLEEEEESQLGHILVVRDAIVSKDVTEAPELGDDVLGGHGLSVQVVIHHKLVYKVLIVLA